VRKLTSIFLIAAFALFTADARSQTRPTSRPRVAPWTQRPFPPHEVNLIAMGDWGRDGKEQKDTARVLASYVDKVGTQFHGLLSVGDNFYVHPKSEYDYLFQSVFEDMYDSKRINFPFYMAFGNHDYERGKARMELAYAAKNPTSRWKMPARWYRVDFPTDKPLVSALILDSNKPSMSADDWLLQMNWIEQQLADRRGAKWMVACAHHPLFSNGAHGDNGVLQVHWGPIFKKYRLDFYACGHDHDLQHLEIKDWPFSFLIAGGGGSKPTKMRRDLRGPFSKSLNGFAHIQFFPDRAVIQYVNTAIGKVVHHFERTAGGQVNVLVKGGNDKASTQPLKVLLGLEDEEKK
jgi:hypothetical protein